MVFMAALVMAACSPDNRMASRMDGTWNISTVEIYDWSSSSASFVLDTTILNAGTVTLVDEGLNKKRDHYDLYTNPGSINLPNGSGSGDYYWSVDVGPNNDIARIEFMVDDYPFYYYFSYNVEWKSRKEMIWTNIDNSAAGLDNGNDRKEVWFMNRE